MVDVVSAVVISFQSFSYEKHGKIKNSINLPLKALDNILNMSDEDFFSEVGIKKGELGSCLLVTHCRSGPRGFKAAHILM